MLFELLCLADGIASPFASIQLQLSTSFSSFIFFSASCNLLNIFPLQVMFIPFLMDGLATVTIISIVIADMKEKRRGVMYVCPLQNMTWEFLFWQGVAFFAVVLAGSISCSWVGFVSASLLNRVANGQ